MADRVLPSRDDAAAMLRGELDEDEGARIVADLLRLAASGRLVDREAFDYEAAKEYLRSVGENYHFAKETVEAALPDLDV